MGSFRPRNRKPFFSQREVEILHLIKEGLSNFEISRKLSLALGTVKWYNRQIFTKLSINSRTQAVERAIEIGLIDVRADQSVSRDTYSQPAIRAMHNLPASLTAFIGRKKEQADLRVILHRATTRMVTIVGAGGIGKTRLALRVAEEVLHAFSHGVWLVDLSQVSDPGLVPQAVANSLGLHIASNLSYEEALVRYLLPRSLLLVLDNCEHLAKACASLVTNLLVNCPHLRILVTSREALGVEGEALYPVLPLPYPDPHKRHDVIALRRYDAVQLFVDRAGLVLPGFTITQKNGPGIALVCQRVDGIPLALELAAARANVLDVEQIAARLDDCFRLLSGGGHAILPRHQTMQSVLDWSYNLLSQSEQVLLRRLAVFHGEWTLDAVEQVCSIQDVPEEFMVDVFDILNQLVNRSMVIALIEDTEKQIGEHNRGARYHLLEPIRQYAQAKLEQAGEVEVLRDSHLAYFRDLAERTMDRPYKDKWGEQYVRLKLDHQNICAALAWGLADADSPRVDDGLRLAGSLYGYWIQAGLNREGIPWLERAFALSENRGPSYDLLRAQMLQTRGLLAGLQSNYHESKRLFDEGIALYRTCGEDWGLMLPLTHLAIWSYPVDQEGSRAAIEESIAIARKVGDPMFLAEALMWKGDIDQKDGNLVSAIRYGQESLDLFLSGGERGYACYPLLQLGLCAIRQGDIAAAIKYREDYLRYRPEIDDLSLDFYGATLFFVTAYYLSNFKEMETIAQNLLDQNMDQNQGATIYAMRYLGAALKCQGEYQRAAVCYYKSICLSQGVNDYYGMIADIAGLAHIAVRTGQPVRAARLFGAVDEHLKIISRNLDWGPEQGEYERGIADLREALEPGDFTRACGEGKLMKLEEAVQEARLFAEELAR